MSTYAAVDRSPAKSKRARVPDPVPELGFKVEIPGLSPIGYFSECSGLSLEYEIEEYKEGGENRFSHKLRGRLKYPNLVLKRGVTHESALLEWFFKTQKRASRATSPDEGERSAITITLVGPDRQPVRTWAFSEAFPVKWTGPTLNASSNNVATETLEIAHNGFVLPLER